MATVYTTAEKFDHDELMQVLLNHRVLCNVTPMQSIAQRKETGDMFVETGAKVDIFDISVDALVGLWLSMRDHLDIHCVWIEHGEYSGCVCNFPAYRQQCASAGVVPLKCSEYN